MKLTPGFKPAMHQTLAHKVDSKLPIKENHISPIAWWSLLFVSCGIAVAFLLFDPKPDIFLAIGAGGSAFITGWGIFRLYALNLLLSPIAAVLIGPGWVIYYSIGNLGSRIAGDGRYAANNGSLAYYPVVAVLAMVGLALFMFIVFGVFGRQLQNNSINYKRMRWHPWQALAVLSIALLTLFYLSSRYEFVNGYFRNVTGVLDQSLAATQYFFISMGVIISVSVLVNNSSLANRLLTIIVIIMLIVVTIGLRSRTSMIMTVVLGGLCWISLRPKHLPVIVGAGIGIMVLVMLLGSFVKFISVSGQTRSVLGNLGVLQEVTWLDFRTAAESTGGVDWQYRMAGYELPATLIASQDRGINPLYGEGMYAGIVSSFPSFLRPSAIASERQTILNHYRGYHLLYADSIGFILSSGIADWGFGFSPIIYAFSALVCVGLWNIGQTNVRIYLALIAVAQGPSDMVGLVGDLFWEGITTSIKFIGFAVILLLILGPLLLPYYVSEAEQA